MRSERKIVDFAVTLGICYFKDWWCCVKVAFEGACSTTTNHCQRPSRSLFNTHLTRKVHFIGILVNLTETCSRSHFIPEIMHKTKLIFRIEIFFVKKILYFMIFSTL